MPASSDPNRYALLALGASTAALQTLAVREGLAVASGNEAVVAMLFGVWMLETALGAALGRRGSPRLVAPALSLYGVLSIGTLLAARASVALVPSGQVPNLLVTALAASVLLAPACLTSGWLYAWLAKPPPGTDAGKQAARAYLLDTLGAGAAGAILALLALDHVLPMRIAAVAVAITALAAATLLVSHRARATVALVGLAGSIVLFATPLDRLTYRWHAPGQTILAVESTSRGALLTTESSGQTQLLLQRQPLLVPSDRLTAEQVAHLPAALHEAPSRVLFVGVPPGDLLERLMEHPVDSVDVVVGDPGIAAAVMEHAPSATHPRVRVHGQEERAWVRESPPDQFDLVIVHAGTPTSVADARLFSATFYASLRRVLRARGMVAVTLPGFAAYASDAERELHGVVVSTLATSFEHRLVLPADVTVLVGSALPLPDADQAASKIEARLVDRGVDTRLVTATWIRDRLSGEKIEQARRWSAGSKPASTDAHPVVFRAAMKEAVARLGDTTSSVLPIGSFTLLFILAFWLGPRSRPVSLAVATTGFAGLSVQLLLMLVYQTAVGALYRDVALVTAAFMGASCAGTLLSMRRGATRGALLASDVAQLGIVLGLALLIPVIVTVPGMTSRFAVVAGAVLIGGSTGAQVGVASRLGAVFGPTVGGTVFALDLMGAALAALVTVTLMVPWLGIAGAAWAIAGAKALSTAALWMRRPWGSEDRRLRVPLPTLLVIAMTAAIVLPSTSTAVMGLTFEPVYQVLVVVVLAGLVAMAFEPSWMRDRWLAAERRLLTMGRRIGVSPLRLFVLAVLLPVAALPLGRCYFSVPFVFCHVCPRPCVFGVVRPYVVTAALLANFGEHRFCQRACPLGLAQSAPGQVTSPRPRRLGRLVWLLRVVALGAVAYLYVMGKDDYRDGSEGVGVFAWFFVNEYAVSAWVLGAAGLALVLSFVIDRPFCGTICPIGATSDLITIGEKRLLRKRDGSP